MPPDVASRRPQDNTATFGHAQWMLVLGVLVALRITNALSIKTFFQPDEYFQSLEPAWQIAFGAESGAWITWVSHNNGMKPPSISNPGIGVAGRVAYGAPSVDLRNRVQNCGCYVNTGRSYSGCKSTEYAHRAQDRPGDICGCHGFLHLEARTEGLWHRQ